MAKFSESAMLVSVNVHCFTATKEDRRISAEVAHQNGVATSVGRYQKTIISKERMETIKKAETSIRAFVREQTSPWLNEGVRILASANYLTFKGALGTLIDNYESQWRALVADWDNHLLKEQARLGPMFKASDYPTNIAERFGVDVKYFPIAESSDFRVQLADAASEELRKQIESDLITAQSAALNSILERALEPVSHMARKLAAYTPGTDGMRAKDSFKDSLVENLRELCDLIPRLNFANDARIEAIRTRIAAELLSHDAEDLRDSKALRDDTAKRAEAIAADIAEFMR